MSQHSDDEKMRLVARLHAAMTAQCTCFKDDGVSQTRLFEANAGELHLCVCRANALKGTGTTGS